MKRVIIATMVLFGLSFNLFADSSYDRTLEVLDTTRDEKVKEVFKELLSAYQDEDASRFLENVSEDRFIQDYITFTDAIYQDFRQYDILEIEYWFNEIVPKGVKRYLTVKWERHSESLTNSTRYTKKGLSTFLFDEIDGKYYLIEIAGNNLWGDSVAEWTEEVRRIPGQEEETVKTEGGAELKPDLTIYKDTMSYFTVENSGTAATTGSFDWEVLCDGSPADNGTYSDPLTVGEQVDISFSVPSCITISITIDTNDDIDELDETNNAN